jgi:hypothetical protein
MKWQSLDWMTLKWAFRADSKCASHGERNRKHLILNTFTFQWSEW